MVNTPPPPPVEPSEAELVAAATVGQREARRMLFERYRDVAFQVAYRVTGRTEDALDVVQDAFIKAFEGLAGFQREAGFKTWLLRIVSNRALDLLRARKLRLAIPLDSPEGGTDALESRFAAVNPAGPSVSESLERAELAVDLRQALDALPAEQRAAFALFATGELTYAEIADALGVPIGTVMSRIFHARKRLQEALRERA